MVINLDSSGNIRVGTDTSTTSAKHLAVFLAALIPDVSYGETSAIKDASYDSETGVLSWLENGAQQSYTMNTPDLYAFLKTYFDDEGNFDPQPILDAIESARTALINEITGVYHGLRAHVSGERYAVVNNIHAVEAKVDAIQEDSNLSGAVAKLTWLAARCQMQRLDVLASLSLSKRKLDDYVVRAPEIRPDHMPTSETVNTFVTENEN